MTTVTGASLLSGVTVQQKYGTYGLSSDRPNRQPSRTTVTSSGDTVQISSEARALYRAQTTGNTTETLSYKGSGTDRTAGGEKAGGAVKISGSSISVKEQVSQLKTEISSLESEIAALEGKAKTDEVAAALLRSKLAQLQTMQARLMGLLAESYQIG